MAAAGRVLVARVPTGATTAPVLAVVVLLRIGVRPVVLAAVRLNFVVAEAYMAEEFLRENNEMTKTAFLAALAGVPVTHEPHQRFKLRVPGAIGLIRTGEVIPYANMVLISG